MKILNGRTGKKVGTIAKQDGILTIETRDPTLQAIAEEIKEAGGVTIPSSSEELEDGTIVDKVEFVPMDDERFEGALDQYLLGKGFYLHGED